MTDEQFDILISRAMDDLPQKYIKGLQNVAIVMADKPTSEQTKKMKLDGSQLLLGLYEGIPLTQRSSSYNLVLPDKMTLFKNSLLAISHGEDELYERIKRTLWHEIAHYYGLDHNRINYLEKRDEKN